MLEYETIDISEGIDQNKSSNSKECSICYCWFFLDINFNYDPYLCNGSNDKMMKAVRFKDVAIIYAKGNTYRVNFCYMTQNDVINLLNNSVLNSKEVL